MVDVKRPQRLAAIDIGSNTVKLLIAECSEKGVEPLIQRSTQTRLGTGLVRTGKLGAEPIEQTLSALHSYLCEAEEFGVAHIAATATSAVRVAKNGDAFVATLRQKLNLPVKVLSGEDEADLIYLGVSATRTSQAVQEIILDIGGGSTEIILARDGKRFWRQSYEVGSVRLLENTITKAPFSPEKMNRFMPYLERQYGQLLKTTREKICSESSVNLIAAGGGAVAASMLIQGLTAFQPAKIDHNPLDLTKLIKLRDRLWHVSLEERRRMPGMPPERADIMPIALAALAFLTEGLGLSRIYVTTAGLRFGLIKRMFDENA